MKANPMLAAAFLVLAACAQTPGAIAPVAMPGLYDGLTCAAARGALAQERQTLAALEQRQNAAVIQDAATVFLVLVPTSSIMGTNVAGDLALSKGKVQALEARLSGC
jgi:hypothetical protein